MIFIMITHLFIYFFVFFHKMAELTLHQVAPKPL